MSLEFITQFVQQKRKTLDENCESIDVLSKQTAADVVSDNIQDTIAQRAVDFIKSTPLVQLGEDFLAEQTTKNGNKVLNNAFGEARTKQASDSAVAQKNYTQ